jgi:lipoyl-dependent peroxiredoxin
MSPKATNANAEERLRDLASTCLIPQGRLGLDDVRRGSGRAGTGDLSSDSGVLANTPYSYRTRFENQNGTNPEELIAAAHAGCFTMALAFRLQAAGYTPTELYPEAAVTLEQAPPLSGCEATKRCSEVPHFSQERTNSVQRAAFPGMWRQTKSVGQKSSVSSSSSTRQMCR